MTDRAIASAWSGDASSAIGPSSAGCLLKDASSETLISAVQAAARGESFLQSTVTARVVAAFAKVMESGGSQGRGGWCCHCRRKSATSLFGGGASNKEIAHRLKLAGGTVKSHLSLFEG